MKNQYRIQWLGWFGINEYHVQIKRRFWFICWWETLEYFYNYNDVEELYSTLSKYS